jgi:hypothetical protein
MRKFFTENRVKKCLVAAMAGGVFWKSYVFYEDYARKLECLHRLRMHFKSNVQLNQVKARSLFLKEHFSPLAVICPATLDQLKKIVYYGNKFGVSIIFNSAETTPDLERPLDKPYLLINLKNLNQIELLGQKNSTKQISVKCGAT